MEDFSYIQLASILKKVYERTERGTVTWSQAYGDGYKTTLGAHTITLRDGRSGINPLSAGAVIQALTASIEVEVRSGSGDVVAYLRTRPNYSASLAESLNDPELTVAREEAKRLYELVHKRHTTRFNQELNNLDQWLDEHDE